MIEEWSLEERALALICAPRAHGAAIMASLANGEWRRILDWAAEHRFGPSLWRGLGEAGLRDVAPPDARAALSKASRESAFRALAVQRDMVRVHDALTGAGLSHIFLKGAYLAHFAYPEPGLRPMRDIDVLVAPADALDAWRALTAAGFASDGTSGGRPEAFVETQKHLPRLLPPGGGLAVEVHTRMIPAGRTDGEDAEILFADRLASSIPGVVAGRAMRFTDAEEMLVHLCVHAVYDHQFDNGPLILCDLRWLLAKGDPDWARVWRRAAQLDATRGLVLLLRLAQRHWPDLRIQWAGAGASAEADPHIVSLAARLMMRSFADRRVVGLLGQAPAHEGRAAKLRQALALIFPPRAAIATQYPLRPGSPLIAFYYVARWLRILRLRSRDVLRLASGRAADGEVRALQAMNVWLAGK